LNWNLEILVFVEGAKPDNPEKLSVEVTRQEPTTKSTHIRHQAGIKPRSHECFHCCAIPAPLILKEGIYHTKKHLPFLIYKIS